ncbi:MAG: M60 family metallopeptidase [Verrucomicrobia bacterium]|nr:M60 family metallopeptidase [Verrucomicrobiota bacterium]
MRPCSVFGLVLCAALLVAAGARAAEPNVAEDIAFLLDGVKEIGAPGVPGPLCVFGDDAFVLVVGGGPGEVTVPVVAAASHGDARLVAFGHDGYLMSGALMTADTGRLMANAVRWAAGGQKKAFKVATHSLAELRAALAERGFAVDELESEDWYKDLSAYDVVCFNAVWLKSEDEVKALRAFAAKGGGLVAGGLGWGWCCLNPGKSLQAEFLGNALYGPAGIVWADGTLDRTSPQGFAAGDAPSELTHAARALDALVAQEAGTVKLSADELAQVSWLVTNAVRVLPADDTALLPRIQKIAGASRAEALPSPDKPLGNDHPLGRLVLTMKLDAIRDVPPQEVEASPAAAAFPGAVPEDAKRVTKTVDVNTAVPGWHSTGLYAAPGELIKVTVPEGAAGKGLMVRIGAHADSIWHQNEWRRCPEICRQFPIEAASTDAANAFGGLIYIEVPEACMLGEIAPTIAGAVEAPRYILGKTDPEQWRETIRHSPGPWTELETNKVVITVPSVYVRTLDDPGELMAFWDQVMDACADLAARPRERERPERYVADTQISAGYMHSGYPIMTHLDIAPVMVSKEAILANEHGGIWGLFHEMGHNHQSGDWTFDGTGEVTVNLFTLYVYETVCNRTTQQHPSLNGEERAKKLAKYFDDGAKFGDWMSDPFLALIMYVQLKEAFGWEAFKKVFADYRDLPDVERPKADDEKRDQWMVRFSREVGKDLGPFFEAWGVPVSAEARALIADLPDWMPEDFPPQGPEGH